MPSKKSFWSSLMTVKGMLFLSIVAIGFYFSLRTFVYEPYAIPSRAMLPTLHPGDLVFVNKFVYGSWVPFTTDRLIYRRSPSRGDLVVFRIPSEPSKVFVKRVVGLPGETVVYENKVLFIDGQRMELSPAGSTYPGNPGGEVFVEKLEGLEHEILLVPGFRGLGGTFAVPEDHYFMMGDHRDSSKDSRFPTVGFIPEDHIFGRVDLVLWNTQDQSRAFTVPKMVFQSPAGTGTSE